MNTHHLDCPYFQPHPNTDTTITIMVLHVPSAEKRKADNITVAVVAWQQDQSMKEQ